MNALKFTNVNLRYRQIQVDDMRIGSRSRTGRVPHNQGLARRADRVLNGLADVKAGQFETSLAVDGVPAAIWSREAGSVICSCRSTTSGSVTSLVSSGAIIDSSIVPVSTQDSNSAQDDADISRHTIDYGNDSGYQYVGNQHTRNGDDALFATSYDQDIISRIQPTHDDLESILEDVDEAPTGMDLLDALDMDQDGSINTMDADGDPLLNEIQAGQNLSSTSQPFSPSMINCPICFDSGKVDSWRMQSAERIVLDLSKRYQVVSHHFYLPEESVLPQQIEIVDDGHFTWTSVDFPRMWSSLVRMVVYDRGRVVSGTEYILEYSTPANPNTFNTLDYSTLKALNNSATLQASNKLNIRIRPADEVLYFTHVEILLTYAPLPRIQVPEITVPNDSEFADWNLSISMEVSAKARVAPTSIISEAKYNRVWKVETLNRKVTSSGKSVGYQVDCRAIHSFEKQFLLARVFGAPIDPYVWAVQVDNDMDEDL